MREKKHIPEAIELIEKYKRDIEICSDLAEQLIKQINKIDNREMRQSLLFSMMIQLCTNVDIPSYDVIVAVDVLHARLMYKIVQAQLSDIKLKLK